MSDQRKKGETVEQYARRLVSDFADGDVDAFREYACEYCSGPSSTGLCRAMRNLRVGRDGKLAQHNDGDAP
jgi:hypothetical protein